MAEGHLFHRDLEDAMLQISQLTLVLCIDIHQIANIRRCLIGTTLHGDLMLSPLIFHQCVDFFTLTPNSPLYSLLLDNAWDFLIELLLNFFSLFIKSINCNFKLSDIFIVNLQIILKIVFFLFELIDLLWKFKGTENLIFFILDETYFFIESGQ